MTPLNALANIPHELRAYPQWVVSNCPITKAPLDPKTGRLASVTNPNTWGTFEQAIVCRCRFIGFVLTNNDPFCILDLDDKLHNPATDEQKERFKAIIQTFNTYTEISQSGRGVHVICKGTVPRGTEHDHVELYSQGRYIIFTGNVLVDQPIKDCQHLVSPMFDQLAAKRFHADLQWLAPIQSDEEVIRMGRSAINGAGHKFCELWDKPTPKGQRSEACMALMSYLAFYSPSDEQVIRLTKQSAFKDYDKLNRPDWITGTLQKIRGSFKKPEVDFSQLSFARKEAEAESKIDWPPGFVGDVAKYIFNTSNRPVKEISIAAAIALIGGISARAFNISNTGLNQYILVIAGTGRGKEEARKGINRLVNEIRSRTLMLNTPGTSFVENFIGPRDFASGQGVMTTIVDQPSCLSILGEFGQTIAEMTAKNVAPQLESLKKALLVLYNTSGHSDILEGVGYSKKENNIAGVKSPNLTILGEGATETFYQSLDIAHISNGLFPRFLAFEYNGIRQYDQEITDFTVPPWIIDKLLLIFQTAWAASQNNQVCNIQIADDAKAILKAYDRDTTDTINEHGNAAVSELWSRSHMKALKLAGTIAVGIDPYNPIVTKQITDYAINVINITTKAVIAKFSTGEVGDGDHRQEHDMRNAFETYWKMTPKQRRNNYKVPEPLSKYNEVVSLNYLKSFLRLRGSFKNDRRGAYGAIDAMVMRMIRDNVIQQVPPEQAGRQFETTAIIYTKGSEWH